MPNVAAMFCFSNILVKPTTLNAYFYFPSIPRTTFAVHKRVYVFPRATLFSQFRKWPIPGGNISIPQALSPYSRYLPTKQSPAGLVYIGLYYFYDRKREKITCAKYDRHV